MGILPEGVRLAILPDPAQNDSRSVETPYVVESRTRQLAVFLCLPFILNDREGREYPE
jgi:hypothetical protein